MLTSVSENRVRVRLLTEEARDANRIRHAKNHRHRQYMVGESVWLYYPVVPRGVVPKLWVPWRGPFLIKRQVSDTVYELEMRNGSRIDGTVSASRLQPYTDRTNWPISMPYDTQEGTTLHLPEDCDEMVHNALGGGSKILAIKGERVAKHRKNRKEYLVEIEQPTGPAKERWMSEDKIAAGDLLHLFRAAKHAAVRATVLPYDGEESLNLIATVTGAIEAQIKESPELVILKEQLVRMRESVIDEEPTFTLESGSVDAVSTDASDGQMDDSSSDESGGYPAYDSYGDEGQDSDIGEPSPLGLSESEVVSNAEHRKSRVRAERSW